MPHQQKIDALESAITNLGAHISAMEAWAPTYLAHPETHVQLINLEAKLEKAVRSYFRGLSGRIQNYVPLNNYNGQATVVKAYDVNVIIEDDALEPEVALMMQAVYDPLAEGVAIGTTAAETIYKIPIGASPVHAAVQKAATTYIAQLVRLNGKQSLVATTRSQIRQSIAASLQMGEDYDHAVARIQKVIQNPVRAAMIARTESVNAYSQGILAYGKETNATAKAWVSSSGPCPICQENIKAGEIPIGDAFPSGDMAPAAHPNDRCGFRLVHDYSAPIPIVGL